LDLEGYLEPPISIKNKVRLIKHRNLNLLLEDITKEEPKYFNGFLGSVLWILGKRRGNVCGFKGV